ncbi:MAG: class I SAM-dependent methyltransferase [Phycisphaerales bacterium]
MQVTIAPKPHIPGGFRELDQNRAGFAEYFAKTMMPDPRLRGRVLDVGCGSKGPDLANAKGELVFYPVIQQASQLDGLDPYASVHDNRLIKEKWHSTLEDAPFPEGAYDALVSFFVLEHVQYPEKFLKAVHRALKPGGVFYALTPNANHPFAWAVHLIETFNVKRAVERVTKEGEINRIPTYYRLNTPSAVARQASQLQFSSLEVFYYPALNWSTYFPKFARFVPRMYDWCVGTRVNTLGQQVLFKLERASA